MAIINVNGISGINSITAQSSSLNFYTAAGSNLPISAETLNVGTGASISSPATNVLTLGTNNVERVRVDSSGNLGIGTIDATPGRLTVNNVNSASTPTLDLRAPQNNRIVRFKNNAGGDGSLYSNGTATTFDWQFSTYNTTNALYLKDNGSVGIGTGIPGSNTKLHIKNAAADDYVRVEHESNDTQLRIQVSSTQSRVALSATYNTTGSYYPLAFLTSDTERMRIDSSGRVTTPYQPAFTAYLSTNYSYTGGGARRAIPFDAVVTNIGSHFNTSTNRFIAPVAGMYLFTASLVCNSGSSTTYFSCDIFVNGAAVPGSSGWQNMGAGYQIQRSSLIVYLNVNDYVDVRMEKSANDTINGASNYSGFTGTLLG